MNRTLFSRGKRLGTPLLLSLILAGSTLLLLWSNARAGLFSGGAGGCGDFAEAIRLAEDGDVVVQMIPAKDSGDVVITKNLRLSGGWLPTENCAETNQFFTETADLLDYGFTYNAPYSRTILNNNNSVLRIGNPDGAGFPYLDALIVEHFELHTFGQPLNGGGVNGVIDDGAEVLLDNIYFDQNEALHYGGGLSMTLRGGSHLRIEDSILEGNTAVNESGGGLFVNLYEGSRLTIDGTEFLSNDAIRSGGFEIHLYDGSELVMRDVLVDDNLARLISTEAGGGGVYVHSGQVLIENSVFRGNSAGTFGGGLYLEIGDGAVQIVNSTFQGNDADAGGDSTGGGVYALLDGGELTIKNSVFRDNLAGVDAGGLYVESVGYDPATVTLVNTTFSGNTPDDLKLVQSGDGTLRANSLQESVYLPATLNNTAGNAPSARITEITLDEENRYAVAFTAENFVPDTSDLHVHFFFDTVAPEDAGVPGSGPWILYGGPSPFTGYSFGDRPFGPDGAEQMCILVANADHSVRLGTGNCVKLP